MSIHNFLQSFTLFLSFLCLAISRPAHAGIFLTTEELERSEAFAADPRFASVGMVRRSFEGEVFENGSAVLISPNWVLTAAHVVTGFVSQGYDEISFGLGPDGLTTSKTARVADWIIHPTYAGAFRTGDIALMRLRDPIYDVVVPELYTGPQPRWTHGLVAQMAGYGMHGVVGEELLYDTTKRAGSNTVVFGASDGGTRDTWEVYTGNFDDRIDMEWKGAPGDSGGGWFVEVEGQWQLSAITVGASLPFNGGGATAATSVTKMRSWIDANMVAVPEPSALGFSAAFLLLCSASNRRRR